MTGDLKIEKNNMLSKQNEPKDTMYSANSWEFNINQLSKNLKKKII
jgi:hypothetical protein